MVVRMALLQYGLPQVSSICVRAEKVGSGAAKANESKLGQL